MIPDAKRLIFSDSTHLAFEEYLFEKQRLPVHRRSLFFQVAAKYFSKCNMCLAILDGG